MLAEGNSWPSGQQVTEGVLELRHNSGIRFSSDDLKQVNMQHLPKVKLLPATYWKNSASKYKLDGRNKDAVLKFSHFLRKTSADEFQHCVDI